MPLHLKLLKLLLIALALPTCVSADESYDDVRPLLERLCYDCHGPRQAKADLRLDRLNPDFLRGGDLDTWHDVLNQLNLGMMPPEDATQPTEAEATRLISWLTRSLRVAAEAKRNAGGRVTSRRLTRDEYAHTMRDLLGVDLDYGREMPPEPASPDGFLNDGATLELSPTQLETYLAVARRALSLAIVEGDRPQVFRHVGDRTAVGALPRSREGGAEPVNPEFLLDVPTFPREGEFEIRVRAGATIPAGAAPPQLRVSLGCVPGIVHVPRKVVGQVDVTATADSPQTFTFRGRMEDYPQSGDQKFGNVAFDGEIVILDFLDADGKELRHASRTYSDPPRGKGGKGKAAKNKPTPAAPILLPPLESPRLDVHVERVEFEAPVVTSWQPASHTSLLSFHGDIELDSDAASEQILRRFASRAFRRPASDDEVQRLVTLFRSLRAESDTAIVAYRETMAAILVSPHFLYLVPSDDLHSLASRMSYFLTSTMPSQRLTELANTGQLADAEVLKAEVQRMLDGPSSRSFVDRFADQWFDLDGLDRVAVNPEFYPDFDDDLKSAMREETRGVLREIIANNLSCLELIDADWTVVNRALANHYQLTHRPATSSFERVPLAPADRRGGILQHGSFLLSNSSGESSHPIKRAVWILDRLLATPPAPPPPDAPPLDAERADLRGLTLKQQLEAHRQREACNRCHRHVDPWGIPLEHFDAVGLYRETPPTRVGKARLKGRQRPAARVDAATELPSGEKLDGATELKRYILQHRREQFARSFVRRLATYALGRQLDFADEPVLQRLTQAFLEDNCRPRPLIADLVASELFTASRPTPPASPLEPQP
ncbi:MAG: DUF1592 domain-containing protein [Planctomycetales bacterium]|nr:DUF1592 domain-containing protein [Planctomycetales bacterium]